ncbi:MAG: hypothetical protein GY839_15625 [candidate division Zixibacteria bacterium]|nr:hypothetical protein [candidate division Zixibacteria bacterium]
MSSMHNNVGFNVRFAHDEPDLLLEAPSLRGVKRRGNPLALPPQSPTSSANQGAGPGGYLISRVRMVEMELKSY